jgi:hypothetical protein
MSVQLTKRRQLYTSCALLALPLALANVTNAQAETMTATAPSKLSTGGSTIVSATVVGAAATAPTTATPAKAATTTPAKPAATATTTEETGLAYSNASKYGNFYRPFAANSLWNSRPVNPVFGTYVIPTSDYYPSIASGAYSTGAFEGLPSDPAVVVYGSTTKGIWDPDSEAFVPSITIPHWPASTTPATGGDGHADIVDSTTGIVHSFWQLKKDAAGRWTANTYGHTRIDGRGWGDPAHYYQGARAAAVPPLGGLIRKHEVSDGQLNYGHALAMSLTFNALAPKPAYIYPATSADTYAATVNSGGIPEGALMMLPPSFDDTKMVTIALRKVARTLKMYGAYVVDQNSGTPFYIYVENNSGFALNTGGWNQAVANDLQTIRAALRQVVSTSGWIDGEGRTIASETTANFNLMSMRGGWVRSAGTVSGKYNTLTQALEFPTTTTASTMNNTTMRGVGNVEWAKTAVGDTLKVTAIATGGAKMRMHVVVDNKVVVDSGLLTNGMSARWVVPAGAKYNVYVVSGVGAPSSMRVKLEKITP